MSEMDGFDIFREDKKKLKLPAVSIMGSGGLRELFGNN